MSQLPLKVAFAAALLGLPVAACSSPTAGTATGAATGAVAGAVVGGPVGAAVGGVAGAAVGATLSAEESTRVRQYVVTQRHPSVRVRDEVVVGYRLSPRVALYPVPPTVGLRGDYRYTVLNNRSVLVDPATREVVYILD
jgi:hypothetical protein